jgi:hypothetical protein
VLGGRRSAEISRGTVKFAGLLEKRLAPPQSEASVQEAVDAALAEVVGGKAAPRFVEALRRAVATIVEGHKQARPPPDRETRTARVRACAAVLTCAPGSQPDMFGCAHTRHRGAGQPACGPRVDGCGAQHTRRRMRPRRRGLLRVRRP